MNEAEEGGIASPFGERFQILALDGGGAKALFSANVLERLEEDLGVRISDSFDLIAGTSAGGLIAMALGLGMRPKEIVEQYEMLVSSVFPRWRSGWLSFPQRLVRPAYRSRALADALGSLYGEKLLGDSEKRLIVPSWDLRQGAVHVFKTPHHERLRRDWKVPMVDVGLATAAAPTYFAASGTDGQRLVDGGVWANNPSVIAIAEAVSLLEVPLSSIRILNVGTTESVGPMPEGLNKAGLGRWGCHVAELFITAGSRGGQGIAEHLIGSNSFQRFDVQVPGGLYRLDKADSQSLKGLASRVSRDYSPIFHRLFADHVASPFKPCIDVGAVADRPLAAAGQKAQSREAI